MKKKAILLLLLLLVPFKVFAYSSKVIPGGETIGIKVNTKGVLVVGFYKIDGKYNKGTPNIKVGDYIVKINNEEVNTIKEMTNIMEKYVANNAITLTIRRDTEIKKINLDLVHSDGKYKTGLYVKEEITGIGTLTYIDPETKIYGALGHEILESNSKSIVEIKDGSIFESSITGITKSKVGTAGSKNAKFNYENVYGNIIKNNKLGIYGTYISQIDESKVVDVSDDIKIGKAIIQTVVNGQNKENFDIEISAVNENSEVKNIEFIITDDRLLKIAGGVVQGMSGSPILQDNKIIGAVTHVTVDNPEKGYGLLITKMLEEGEK